MTQPIDPTQDYPGNLPSTTLEVPSPFSAFTECSIYARGGLGEVLKATDPKLHRTVAIKRLQDRHADTQGFQQRFLAEAEITARLEHPGVVPVHGLFHDEKQRPCYVMRFIEGQTFAETIKAYHQGHPDPIAFRRLLQNFIQVCRTIAYAHSRGVIHRDLKPSNIMLGRFGETLVVDWGLAKIVGRRDELRGVSPDRTLDAVSGGNSSETVMGSAVGTPAYMSPEQALGRWDVVAQPSDIYSLGGVFYTLLTGKMPLEKGNWPEMQQKIQQGKISRPRQVKPDIPIVLESICLKAMAIEETNRFSSAEALAEDVEHWLADEPVSAAPDSIFAKIRRWMRDHRTLVSTAIVFLIAAVIGLTIGTVLLQRSRNETDRERHLAITAQKKTETLNRFLIEDLLKQTDPTNNKRGAKITVRQLLDKATERLEKGSNLAQEPEVEAEVRSVMGHAYEYLGVFDRAEQNYRRGVDLMAAYFGADDRKTLALRNRLTWALIEQDKLPEAEEVAQRQVQDCIRVFGEQDADSAEAISHLGEIFLRTGKASRAITLIESASKTLHQLLGPENNLTLEVDNNLANALTFLGSSSEAESRYQSVLERRLRLTPDHPELANTLSNLGAAQLTLGRWKDAEKSLQLALSHGKESRGENHPGTLATRNLVGYAIEGQGRWAEAEKIYLEVLVDRRRVLGPISPIHNNIQKTISFLARMYAKQEKWPNAAPYLAELVIGMNPTPKRAIGTLTPILSKSLTGEIDASTAEPLLKEVWEALQTRMLKGDWLTAEIASRYGECLRRLESYPLAEKILLAAQSDIEKAVGVPSWSKTKAKQRIIQLYQSWNKPDEVKHWKKTLTDH